MAWLCVVTHGRHIERLPAMFDRLVDVNLTVNLAKCEFAKAAVTYQGKVVGQAEVCPMQAKVEAIYKFPIPISRKELMHFFRVSGVLPQFLPLWLPR